MNNIIFCNYFSIFFTRSISFISQWNNLFSFSWCLIEFQFCKETLFQFPCDHFFDDFPKLSNCWKSCYILCTWNFFSSSPVNSFLMPSQNSLTVESLVTFWALETFFIFPCEHFFDAFPKFSYWWKSSYILCTWNIFSFFIVYTSFMPFQNSLTVESLCTFCALETFFIFPC